MNSPSASPVTVVFTYVCVCHVLLRLFEGGVLFKKYSIIITMAFVRFVVAAAAAVYQEPHL